jgi:hypothetical protein
MDLDTFNLDDMNFRLKKVPRIYADAFEHGLEPTKQSNGFANKAIPEQVMAISQCPQAKAQERSSIYVHARESHGSPVRWNTVKNAAPL